MNKEVGLQWGRGIAAVSVVIGHAIAHPYQHAPEQAHLMGRAGVTLFFVISGYIMVLTTGAGRFDPAIFMRKRILRIVPLYYLATFVLAAGALFVPQLFKSTAFNINQITTSLLFIPAYTPESDAIEPFMKLGWTLNFEMFFYAVFALLFWLTALQRAVALSMLFGSLMIVGQMVTFTDAIPAYYTRIDLLGFVAGVWLAVLAKRYEWKLKRWAGWAGLATALALTAYVSAAYGQIRSHLETQILLVGICTLYVAVLALGEQWFVHIVPGWMTRVGDATYSIYLFHMFAIGAVTTLGARFVPPDLRLIVIVTAAALGVALGMFVYQHIEVHMSRLTGRWGASPRPKTT